MDSSVKLVLDQGKPYFDPGGYKWLVGELNYLITTCPNIAFAVNVVNQFLNSPCQDHWDVDAVVRVLKYIKNVLYKGLIYKDKGNTKIIGHSYIVKAKSPSKPHWTLGKKK